MPGAILNCFANRNEQATRRRRSFASAHGQYMCLTQSTFKQNEQQMRATPPQASRWASHTRRPGTHSRQCGAFGPTCTSQVEGGGGTSSSCATRTEGGKDLSSN